MDLLARREHSRLELENKLKKRFPDADTNTNIEALHQALELLIQEGLLSDERFCEAFVHYRKSRGYGPVRIRSELKLRGVSDQLIATYLDVHLNEWIMELTQLINKKYGGSLALDTKSQAKRQRFLYQRGYTFEQINTALRNLVARD